MTETATGRLDTKTAEETPEGVLLSLHLAGPFSRANAYAIDLALRAVLLFAIATLAGALDMVGGALVLLTWFGLEWLYPVYFEVWHRGQTPGKRLCGLAVLHDDGTPVTLGPSLIRNLLRAVDALPIGYAVGCLTMLGARRFQRIGDLAAGTLVARVAAAEMAPVPAPLAAPAAGQVSPSVLLPDERRAVVEFARRLERLTPERAEELARTTGHLLRQVPDGRAAAALLGLAHEISGTAPPVSSEA